jgi:hypothetical protein
VSVYEELKQEMDKAAAIGGGGGGVGSVATRRKDYAAMDIGSMGVDVDTGPETTLDNKIKEEKMRESVDELDRDDERKRERERERERERKRKKEKERKRERER